MISILPRLQFDRCPVSYSLAQPLDKVADSAERHGLVTVTIWGWRLRLTLSRFSVTFDVLFKHATGTKSLHVSLRHDDLVWQCFNRCGSRICTYARYSRTCRGTRVARNSVLRVMMGLGNVDAIRDVRQ